jgi:hypothetical protein
MPKQASFIHLRSSYMALRKDTWATIFFLRDCNGYQSGGPDYSSTLWKSLKGHLNFVVRLYLILKCHLLPSYALTPTDRLYKVASRHPHRES